MSLLANRHVADPIVAEVRCVREAFFAAAS